MRKVKLSAAVSLDGYAARLDHTFDWIFTDQDYGLSELFRSVDVALIGRKTHDLMVRAGRPSYPGMANYVFSRSKTGSEGGVEFVSSDLKSFIAGLREKAGKDIWLVGGGQLIRSFLTCGLVDEISLAVHPILLGSGIPLFPPGFPQTSLQLVQYRQYSTGLVESTYKAVKSVSHSQ
jgi:dihydrofolate reductase